MRRFGTWLLLEPGELEPYLGARVGEEPLVAAFTAKALGERLDGRRAPLKAALLDQRTLAGLGNIYVDEALWYARLHPLRPAGALDRDELRRLHRGDPAGARARDRAPGLDADRLPAARRLARARCRSEFRAYGRLGRAVRPLRHADREDRVGGRGTWFCPQLPASLEPALATTVRRRGCSSSAPDWSSRQSSV